MLFAGNKKLYTIYTATAKYIIFCSWKHHVNLLLQNQTIKQLEIGHKGDHIGHHCCSVAMATMTIQDGRYFDF
jgi:hypothetical protein